VFRVFITLFLAFLLSSCATTMVRRSPDYEKKLTECKEVLVLPPEVKVHTLDISNKRERMYNYEDHLEEMMKNKIVAALRDKRLKVKFLNKRDIYNQKLSDKVAALRNAYNDSHKELYSTLAMKEEEAYAIEKKLGKPAIELGKATKSSIILLTDYSKTVKTNGARTRDFMISMLLGSHSTDADESLMIVGIIDARNGSILWTNRSYRFRDVFSSSVDNLSAQSEMENKELDTLTSNVFNPLLMPK
jgi:hypothetical protein